MTKKYIDAEKLKAEIERQRLSNRYIDTEGYEAELFEIIDSLQSEQPGKFTDFEWLIGKLMFRGCDLEGMTDGEDDNGTVTKLVKDRAAEMMELLERKLEPKGITIG